MLDNFPYMYDSLAEVAGAQVAPKGSVPKEESPACIMHADILLVKVSHMTSPRLSWEGGTTQGHEY